MKQNKLASNMLAHSAIQIDGKYTVYADFLAAVNYLHYVKKWMTLGNLPYNEQTHTGHNLRFTLDCVMAPINFENTITELGHKVTESKAQSRSERMAYLNACGNWKVTDKDVAKYYKLSRYVINKINTFDDLRAYLVKTLNKRLVTEVYSKQVDGQPSLLQIFGLQPTTPAPQPSEE